MSQKISQKNPRTPVIIKDIRQPHKIATKDTNGTEIAAPMEDPALNIPTANALSFSGNHSLIDLIPAGKFPDSVTPRKNRATENWVTELAKACNKLTRDHVPTE